MPVDTFVEDPETIKELDEVEDYLSRIRAYELEEGCKAGVIKIQRRQFKALHEIVSEEKAKQEMSKPVYDDGKGNRTCEWGIKFYPRSYFEELRDKLNGNGTEQNYQQN